MDRWTGRGLAVAATLAIAVALAPRAQAQTQRPAGGDRSLTVVNRSRQPINEIRVSSAHDDDWGANRLGGSPLETGRSFTIRLSGRDCAYDAQVHYGNGKVEERRGIDVCKTRQVAFDGSKAEAPSREEAHQLILLNRGTRAIAEVYLSGEAEQDWGEDRLDQDRLRPGQRATIDFQGDCQQDVRVVYDNKSAEERREVDVCAAAGVVIRPGWTTETPVAPETTPDSPAEPDDTHHIRWLAPAG